MTTLIKMLVLVKIFLLLLMLTSCTNDFYSEVPIAGDKAPSVQDSTYCAINLKVSYQDDPSTRATDEGTVDERKVTSLTLMFFSAGTDKLEMIATFNDLDQVGDGYRLKKPLQTTAGIKRVVALANLTNDVKMRLANVKTYSQLKDFVLNTGSGYYEDPNSTYLKELGIQAQTISRNHAQMMPETSGLLMTGECEADIKSGVSEAEATAGSKNNISNLHLERVMVKIRLEIPGSLMTDIQNKYPIYYLDNTVSTPIIALVNVPSRSYLMKRTGDISPSYSSVNFDNWVSPYYVAMGFANWTPVDKSAIVYVPENTFADAYRGNVTFFKLDMRFTANSSRLWNSFYVFYDEIGDKTLYHSGSYVTNPWRASDVENFFNNKKADYMGGSTLQRVCVMPKNLRNQSDQEAELKLQMGGVASIPNGYYLFVYMSSMVDPSKKTEVWYDEMMLCQYVDGKRISRRDFKSAFYNSNISFRINIEDASIDINSSKRYALKRNEYWVVKVTGVKPPTGKGFEPPGYPRGTDLSRPKGDKLIESGLEFTVSVTKWTQGGNNDVELED